jgi:hypothetical protein
MDKNKKRILVWIALITVVLGVGLFFLGDWAMKRQQNATMINNAIMHPKGIKPGEYLNTVDEKFKSLPEAEKKRIMDDPKLLEDYVAKATTKELQKSFKLLFYLPRSMRKKMIKETAEKLLKKAENDPDKINAVFSSVGGRGALRGASNFFLLNLTGKQKAELAPVTNAMYLIVRQQSRGINVKTPIKGGR